MNSLNMNISKYLLKVEKPGRYVGGEYGSIKNMPNDNDLSIALSFPDLYEISMSNQALKYLYSYFNDLDKVHCERVFSPAPDFEKILREENIPLFTLENSLAVKDFDILAFTVGYELSASNILNILELSGIPLSRKVRGNNDPIVIAGGPAMTNPLPYSDFFDAVYIGEVEESFISFLSGINDLKDKSREEKLKLLKQQPGIWYPGKEEITHKSVWNDFPNMKPLSRILVPNIQIIQDVGVVEIMRGCPNGCRFCHAGILYRPFRERKIENIFAEVKNLITNGGYREITLSSLSTGDFGLIGPLVKQLNAAFKEYNISFSLPSLKINSFTLDLLKELSAVRKSGLTFAVETPILEWQKGLNKEASKERIIEILKHAKALGWKTAKFYFMLGLPTNDDTDIEKIIEFITEISIETKVKLNVNIGTFIPKPHTPFQWCAQLGEQKALDKIHQLKNSLRGSQFKVGYHAPFTSLLEGIIARGDERVGDILLQAFKKGARLDAWEEHVDWGLWRTVIEDQNWDVENEVCSPIPIDKNLPWDTINLGAGKKFLKDEYEKSQKHELTSTCTFDCDHQCGACGGNEISLNEDRDVDIIKPEYSFSVEETDVRFIFRFHKNGKAVYYSHKNIMNIFERTLLRSGLKFKSTQGFNPKPKMEFASPLALGLESTAEFVCIDLYHRIEDSNLIISKFNESLPQGLKIISIETIVWQGKKIPSLSSKLLSANYTVNLTRSLKEFINEPSEPGISYSFKDYGEDSVIMKLELSENKAQSSVVKVLLNHFKLDVMSDECSFGSIVNCGILRTDLHFK